MREPAVAPNPPFDLYRFAFLLAALTAIRAIALPPEIWQGDYSRHAHELIFGFMTVQLFGFMLKALPRWVGRPILSPGLARSILMAHALAFVTGLIDLQLGAQARSVIGLAAIAALSVTAIRARAARTYPLLALAAAHAATGIVAAFSLSPEATMSGFCLILAICFEVGNRIFPIVIEAGRSRDGTAPRPLPPAWLSLMQRVTSLATLLFWALDLPYAIIAAIAGISGLAWMVRLAPWQVFRHGGVPFMTFAMAAKRTGFLLLALQALPGATMPLALPLHVLAIGGLASLAVAIATSIIRKRNGYSFRRSVLGTATCLCLAGALALRIAAAVLPELAIGLLVATQISWLAGFCGYGLLILQRNRPACAGL